MADTKMVIDPLGNKVVLPETLCNESGQHFSTEDIYDDVVAVIEKPAMLFRVSDGKIENYYYRSIGWDHVLLIGTVKEDGNYKAYACSLNPPGSEMIRLLSQGKQLI